MVGSIKITSNLTLSSVVSGITSGIEYTDNSVYSFQAKPFLKWAGGKKQLLEEFDKRFPQGLRTGEITKYVEPFVGGGAVLFYILSKFKFKECHIYDINEELILTYSVVKNNVEALIDELKALESDFLQLEAEKRKDFFYSIREKFNESKKNIDFSLFNPSWVPRAAQIIFLNRTCFNGLFRVNSKGEFNVPFGKYKNPRILNDDNLRCVSIALANVEIHLGDFEECEGILDERTFVYFDPPYRPISKTSSFTSYSKDAFDEKSQIRLSEFYKKMDLKGVKLMLSNSDPKNEKPEDHFFENNYLSPGSKIRIDRVPAKRMINSKSEGRGAINELIITNYLQKTI